MMGRDHALTGAAAFAALAPLLPATAAAPLAVGIIGTAGAAVLPDIDHPDSTVAQTFGFVTGAFGWIVEKISGGHRHGTHSIAGIAAATVGAWYAGKYQASGPAAGGHAAWSLHMLPAGLYLALIYAAAVRVLAALPVLRGGRRRPLIGPHLADLAGAAGAAATLYLGTDLAAVTAWHIPLLALVTALGCASHIAGDELTHGGCPLLWPVSLRRFHLLGRVQITTNKLAEHWIVSPLLLLTLAYLLCWRDTSAAASIRDAMTRHLHSTTETP